MIVVVVGTSCVAAAGAAGAAGAVYTVTLAPCSIHQFKIRRGFSILKMEPPHHELLAKETINTMLMSIIMLTSCSFRSLFLFFFNITKRFTHNCDPIPRLPLEAMFYRHVPQEIFESSKVWDGKLTQCDRSGEDPKCIDQYNTCVSVDDHLNYQNVTMGINGC